MCNCLHDDSVPIKEEGIGWKLFISGKNNDFAGDCRKANGTGHKTLLKAFVGWFIYTSRNKGNTVKWDKGRDHYGVDNDYGFCFFITRRGAERALKLWGPVGWRTKAHLVKINYKGGLGKHKETGFVGQGTTIALCKEFSLDPSERKRFTFKYLGK